MVLILIHLFRGKDHLTLLVKLDGLSVSGFGGGGVALLDGPLFEPAGTQNVEPAIVVWGQGKRDIQRGAEGQ